MPTDYLVVGFREHGPVPRTAGARRCRVSRLYGGRYKARLTVRHGPDGLIVVPVKADEPKRPSRRSWRAWVAFPGGLAVLAAGLALLLTGPHLWADPESGFCPARTSRAAYAEGQELLVRAEPAVGGTTLVHLCADRAIGPVRDWSVRIGTKGTAGEAVGVQGVASGEALAAAPLAAGERTTMSVVIVSGSGRTLTFVTGIAPA